MAPAGIEISITGSVNAVCTSATLPADDVICVIAQDQQAQIGQQARQPDAPEHRMPQRGGDAIGGKLLTFRLFGHCPFRMRRVTTALDSPRFKVMPAKVLLCPVLKPLSAVTEAS
jgi:hypothetical protein